MHACKYFEPNLSWSHLVVEFIWNDPIVTEEIRGVANISEEIIEARLRRLSQIDRKTDEDVVMRTWKMEVKTKTVVER